jgi:asparagine synthase (glutamine-hydrolysing)
MEKWWLRKAFDGTDLLPDSILWRKKEAFSDGISSTEKSWFQVLQEFIDKQVTDEEFATMNSLNCPTKESYYYMKIFIELFGKDRVNIIKHYWQPKFKADGTIVDFNDKKSYVDPSARTLKIYNDVSHQ